MTFLIILNGNFFISQTTVKLNKKIIIVIKGTEINGLNENGVKEVIFIKTSLLVLCNYFVKFN